MRYQYLLSNSFILGCVLSAASYAQVKEASTDVQGQVSALSEKLEKAVKNNPAFGHQPAEGPGASPKMGTVIVNDSTYKMTIGGFARLDLLYTYNQIGDPRSFVTATIPVKSTAPGPDYGKSLINGHEYTPAKKQYNFSANRSRLFVKAERAFSDALLKVYVEGDFWSGGNFRLRHAYGEFENIAIGKGRGALLLGQTYSAFTVNDSQPEVLDNQGPNGNVADRFPMVTWRHELSDWFMYKLSIEQSQYDPSQNEITVSGIKESVKVAEYQATYPMFVVAAILGDAYRNIQFSLAYSHIEVDLDVGDSKNPPLRTLNRHIDGYAANMGGKLAFGESDFVRYYAAYSRGLGLLIPDLETGYSDGVFGLNAAEDKVLYIDSFGTMLALEHYWVPKLSSNLVWSYVGVDNVAGQASYAYKHANYLAANLIWKPTKQLMFGAEYLWGDRENKDGDKGRASRQILSAQFNF